MISVALRLHFAVLLTLATSGPGTLRAEGVVASSMPVGRTASGSHAARKDSAVKRGYDIIVVEGQSNASGRGGIDPALDTAVPNVYQFDSRTGSPTYRTIIPASDPLKHNDASTKVGPAMSRAKAYAARTGRKVLLVPVAVGGTNLNVYWNPDLLDGRNVGYLSAVSQANLAVAAAGEGSQVVEFMSIQGESDAEGGYVKGYEPLKIALIAALRANVTGAENARYVIGQMVPDFFATKANYRNVDRIHRHVAAIIPLAGFAKVGPGYASVDTVHYMQPAPRLMGVAMDAAALNAASRLATAVPGVPTGLSLEAATATSMLVHFTYPAEGGPLADFVVEYKPTSVSTWRTFSKAANSYDDAVLVTGLSPNASYDFRVAARNVNGTGGFTESTTARTAVAR